jgi:hypothetical protein
MTKEIASALIGSLIPILITTFFAWLGNRNDQSKRKKLIDDARQRIELINTYIASQSLVVSDSHELEAIRKAAANELCGIKELLDHRLQRLQKAAETSDNYLLRFFLLYGMRSGRARFFRLCFFATLVAAAFIAFLLVSTAFSASSIQEYGISFNVIMTILMSMPGILLALMFRWLAKISDRPLHPTRGAPGFPSTSPPEEHQA